MAVRESLRNMQELQAASLKLKKQKEAERQKKQEEKEILERIKKEIERFLHSEFSENLQCYGSNYIIEYYNINKKNALLGCIWANHTIEKEIILFENKNTKDNLIIKNGIVIHKNNNNKIIEKRKIIEYKEFIQDYFNKNYYKILKQEEEIQKKNETFIYYNTLQQQINTQENAQVNTQELKQKNINVNTKAINKTINTILIILLAIICFPIAIVIAACKNQK